MKDYHVLIQVDIDQPAEVSQKVCCRHNVPYKRYDAKNDRFSTSLTSHGQASNSGLPMLLRKTEFTICSSLPRMRKVYSESE